MKKGKIILGAAAFLVTAASTLAFKAHSKNFFQGRFLYAETSPGSCNCTISTCHTIAGGSLNKSVCHTLNGSLALFTKGATGNGTIWTSRTTTNNQKCLHPITKWNHNR